MASEDIMSFRIKADVEVEKSSMAQAEKLLDQFYDKYEDRSMKIDTADMVKTAREGINKIQKLYKQGMKEMSDFDIGKSDSPAWWAFEDGLEESFGNMRTKMQGFFKEMRVVFSDGSIAESFDDMLEKMDANLSVVAVDLGERFNYIEQEAKELFDELKRLSNLDVDLNLIGDFNKGQLEEQLDLIEKIIAHQKELEQLSGRQLESWEFPTEYFTSDLEGLKSYLKGSIREISELYDELGIEFTTSQLRRRDKIYQEVSGVTTGWGRFSQSHALSQADDEEAYNKNLETLQNYINKKKALLDQLQGDETRQLFSSEEVDRFSRTLKEQIAQYEHYIKELQDFRNKKVDMPLEADGVVKALGEIKEAIREIKDAFEPLTTALKTEGTAFQQMAVQGGASLDTLAAKIKEVSELVDQLNKKEFNVTNVTSVNAGAQAELDQIIAYRKEAKELYKQVAALVDENVLTGSKIKQMPWGMPNIMHLQELMSDFDLTGLKGRTNNRSAVSLGVLIDELNSWKALFLEFNELRNKVEAGSFNSSKYPQVESAKIASLNKDEIQDVAEAAAKADASIKTDTNSSIEQIKTLREQVEAELKAINIAMEDAFSLKNIEPNYQNIQDIANKIFEPFKELETKIKALDFNIPVPEIKNNALESSGAMGSEDAEFKNISVSADDAAAAKEKFAQANQEVKESADSSNSGLKEEEKNLKDLGNAAEDTANKVEAVVDKIQTSRDKDGKLTSITTTQSTIGQDSIDTTISRYDANGALVGTTLIENYKKKIDAAKKEATKIKTAQTNLQKFLSQFNSKTAGMGQYLTGFEELSTFQIKNIDDIDKVIQKMMALDAEYNKVSQSFRKGTKSMNPFANAVNSIDEMENKIKQAEAAFDGLKTQPEELKGKISNLIPLLGKMQSAITRGADGSITSVDIYKLSEAYGELNVALKQVNSSITTQKKIEISGRASGKSSDVQAQKELNALYQQRNKIITQLLLHENKANTLKTEKGRNAARANMEAAEQELKIIDELIEAYGNLVDKKKLAQQDDRRKRTSSNNAAKQEYKETEDAFKKYESKYKSAYDNFDKINQKMREAFGSTPLDDNLVAKVEKYKTALKELDAVYDQLSKDPTDSVLKSNFDTAVSKVQELRQEIEGVIKASKTSGAKFGNLVATGNISDPSDLKKTRAEMEALAAEATNGQFKFKSMSDAGTEMYGTMRTAAGAIQEVTVALKQGSKEAGVYVGKMKEVPTFFGQLKSAAGSGIASLAGMYLGLHDIIRYVGNGVQAVREIDTALTELKKVTDETEASYAKFLDTMSSKAGNVGSTVKELTTSAADWARLNI